MADIRKRKGSKGTQYQVRHPSKATKSGYAYRTFNTLKEAVQFRDSSAAIADAPAPRAEIADVADGVQKWLDICEKIGRDGRETVEPETLKEYQRRGRIIVAYNWTKTLQDIEPADVIQFRNWLLENHNRDVARRALTSFHSMLLEMKFQQVIKSDPAAGITVKSGGRYEEHDAELEIPSDAEIRSIYQAADAMPQKNDFMRKCWARYRPLIYLAGFTGMRPSEYRGLPWSSVFEDHILIKQRADRSGIIGPVKSRAGRRKLYIPRFVAEMVEEWRADCPASENDLVFPTASGKPMVLTNFRQGAWDPLMREAGLVVPRNVNGRMVDVPKYTPYAFRHYFASKLIEKGKDLKFIQSAMGHSKIEITLNVYAHLIRDRDEQHRETLEEMALDILGER